VFFIKKNNTKNKQANILIVVAAKNACAYNALLICPIITIEITVKKVSPAMKENSNQNLVANKWVYPK
jgi:hypothetical protein